MAFILLEKINEVNDIKKIEKDRKRALLFYAGMLMVMNDIIEMYGE